jgi:hypothetical protein
MLATSQLIRLQDLPMFEAVDPLEGTRAASLHEGAWYVYLFALTDCSSFKVGFSCNPLQRIYTFSRRYFERFDLRESHLLQLGDCEQARALETRLKAELAAFRVAAPPWLPSAAGGHTEWFSAVQLPDAAQQLRGLASEATPLLDAFEFVRGELARLGGEFELWASASARQLHEPRAFPTMAARLAAAACLRDWLDAYRCCEVPLFVDDAAVRTWVGDTVRLFRSN